MTPRSGWTKPRGALLWHYFTAPDRPACNAQAEWRTSPMGDLYRQSRGKQCKACLARAPALTGL